MSCSAQHRLGGGRWASEGHSRDDRSQSVRFALDPNQGARQYRSESDRQWTGIDTGRRLECRRRSNVPESAVVLLFDRCASGCSAGGQHCGAFYAGANMRWSCRISHTGESGGIFDAFADASVPEGVQRTGKWVTVDFESSFVIIHIFLKFLVVMFWVS